MRSSTKKVRLSEAQRSIQSSTLLGKKRDNYQVGLGYQTGIIAAATKITYLLRKITIQKGCQIFTSIILSQPKSLHSTRESRFPFQTVCDEWEE